MGIYPWKVNHHSAIVNLSWHPSVFGVRHRCLPHLRKDFDSVPHLPLLNKLKNIELEQHVLQWLTSFLSDSRCWQCNFLNKSIVVRGTTRICLRSFVISDLHQLCMPGATIWGINDFNVCWWHSSLQADSPSWKLWCSRLSLFSCSFR